MRCFFFSFWREYIFILLKIGKIHDFSRLILEIWTFLLVDKFKCTVFFFVFFSIYTLLFRWKSEKFVINCLNVNFTRGWNACFFFLSIDKRLFSQPKISEIRDKLSKYKLFSGLIFFKCTIFHSLPLFLRKYVILLKIGKIRDKLSKYKLFLRQIFLNIRFFYLHECIIISPKIGKIGDLFLKYDFFFFFFCSWYFACKWAIPPPPP